MTVNHRLGALGIFAHPALDAEYHVVANYGLLDQQESLRWVQNSVASFGGSHVNVIVFDDSAGTITIYTQLVSRLAARLFQKAIIESGAPADETLATAETRGNAVAAKVRAVPADKLVAAKATRSPPSSTASS